MPSKSSRAAPVISEPSSRSVKAAVVCPRATRARPSIASGHCRNCLVTPAVVTIATRTLEKPQHVVHERKTQRAKPFLVSRVDTPEQLEGHKEDRATETHHADVE